VQREALQVQSFNSLSRRTNRIQPIEFMSRFNKVPRKVKTLTSCVRHCLAHTRSTV